MYHYKVDRHGRVYWTRDLEQVVWAAYAANTVGLMVCFDATKGQPPTEAQKSTARALASYFFTQRPDLPNLTSGRIYGHGELTWYGNSTDCPGPDILDLVRRMR